MHNMKLPVDGQDRKNPFQFDLKQIISFFKKDSVYTVVEIIALEGNQTTIQSKFILNPPDLAWVPPYDRWAMQDSSFQQKENSK